MGDMLIQITPERVMIRVVFIDLKILKQNNQARNQEEWIICSLTL